MELNEAFAPQALAVINDFEDMGIDPEKSTRWERHRSGSSVGSNGSILTLTCAYGLRRPRRDTAW